MPKQPQPFIGLVVVASLPIRLFGIVCTVVWIFAAQQVTKTVRDGRWYLVQSFSGETTASKALAPAHLRRGPY